MKYGNQHRPDRNYIIQKEGYIMSNLSDGGVLVLQAWKPLTEGIKEAAMYGRNPYDGIAETYLDLGIDLAQRKNSPTCQFAERTAGRHIKYASLDYVLGSEAPREITLHGEHRDRISMSLPSDLSYFEQFWVHGALGELLSNPFLLTCRPLESLGLGIGR